MRKLGFGTLMHHEEKSVDSKNTEKGETSKISGAIHCDGSDYKIVKCSIKDEKNIKPTRKLKMDIGFVDFTDDYHGPRHHLPKHN